MKKFVALFLSLVILICLCSCSVTQKDSKFTVGVIDEIKTFNPFRAQGDAEKIIAVNCFEGLLRFNASGHIDLAGATGYSVSSDMLTYTFSLNPSARWYISEAAKAYTEKTEDFKNTITANDYIFSIKHLKKNFSDDIKIIKKISAVDDYTLKITLSEADRDFLNTLASIPFYPCNEDFFTASGENYGSSPDTILTNGIYRIAELSKTGEVTLKANNVYKGNSELLNKEVFLYPTGKESALLSRFENGDYDIFLSSNLEASLGRAATDPLYTSEIWGLSFNFKKDIIKNEAFRKAIASAMDFSKIKTPSFAAQKAEHIIPQNYSLDCEAYGSFQYKTALPEYSQENAVTYCNKALSQLKADSVSIVIAVPEELKDSFIEICTGLQKIFGKKLVVELSYFDACDAEKIAEKGNYHIAVLPLKPKKATAKSVLSEISSEPCFFTDKKFEGFLSVNAPQTEKTAKSYSDAENYIINKSIFIPLFYSGTVLYIADYVTGIYSANNGDLIYFHSGERIR